MQVVLGMEDVELEAISGTKSRYLKCKRNGIEMNRTRTH
jgi:hypothetical protein